MIVTNSKMPDAKHSNLILSTQSFISVLSTEVIYPDSKTSVDELTLNVDTFTSFNHRTSVRAHTNLLLKVSSNR